MKFIDSSQLLVLSTDEVCSLPEEKLQNPDNFATFAQGIKIDPELLFSDKWQNISIGQDYKSLCDFIMKEMLPAFYDHSHLLSHGEVGIVITGIANYTLAPINGRVVGMDGLPTDYLTGAESVTFAIDPNILMAFCRGLTLAASESFLDEDDEWEDRDLSTTELELYGMPAGGANCLTDLGVCVSDASISGSCVNNASSCLANSGIIGGVCSANYTTCGVNGGGGSVCGGNVGACGANASAGGVCGGKASVCASNATLGSACGGNASACGTKASAGSTCGAKASACGVDVAGACPANAVACGINLPGDIVGACIVNILPFLPSC